MYGAGSGRELNLLIAKSFKVTMGLALLPLGFFSVFGTTVVYAWTGEAIPTLRITLWLICLAGFFSTFSILSLVLYRVSGEGLLDNIRQVLVIALLFTIAIFARRLGFYGVLAGLAVTELSGMLFMLYAVSKTFEGFRAKILLPDAARVALGSIAILAAGAIAGHLPIPHIANPRMLATVKLGMISLGCLLAAWPALVFTNAVSTGERKALLGILLPQRMRPAQVSD